MRISQAAASWKASIRDQVRPFAYIFIPLGLLCACGLVWAVAHITRTWLSLPYALRHAAKHKEFFVEYQPIVNLATERYLGAGAPSALARLRRAL